MATISEWRRYMAPEGRSTAQLIRELTDRLSTYEARKRYHDAASGEQYFAETAHREANQRLLDATRKRLAELDPQ